MLITQFGWRLFYSDAWLHFR